MSAPDWEQGPAQRPRRRGVMAAVAVLAVLGVGFAARQDGALSPGPTSGTLDVAPASPSPSAASPSPSSGRRRRPGRVVTRNTPSPSPNAAAGAWREFSPPPDATLTESTWTWAGDELISWGGVNYDPAGPRLFADDGAALDPATDTWRTLADSPLEPRTGASTAWTGTELIVWGGLGRTAYLADGAAYDPAADRWRPMAPAPLSPRSGAALIWTGTEVLVVGGGDNQGPVAEAAAYDPAADRWRPLPPLPAELVTSWLLRGVWAGTQALVWGPGFGDSAAPPGPAAWYDPALDAWVPLELTEPQLAVVAAVWSGERLFVLAGNLAPQLWSYTPDEQWRRLADAEEGPAVGNPSFTALVWTGEELLFSHGEPRLSTTAYSFATNSWSDPLPPLTPSGYGFGTAWTGTELLLWRIGFEPSAAPPVVGWRFAR